MTSAPPIPLPEGKLFIGGQWVAPQSGRTFPTINPATNQILTSVAEADLPDLDAAVTAARKAFEGGAWPKMSAAERGRILWKMGDRLLQRGDEVARLETLDNGKPIFESRQVEIPLEAEILQYYAGWATKITGDTILSRAGAFTYTLREPVGVVAAIVPWNFPLLLTIWKVAPALAAGNTVIVKPSSNTPLTALMLAEIASEAGLPEGVLNVLTGKGSHIGMALVRHPGVDKIAFTGETKTGVEIMKAGAETLKKVTLELGGKSPNIVFADADLEAAVRGATVGIFYGKGEVCAAGSRLFVEKKIHDEFMDKLVARTKKMLPGDPLDPKTRFGAIVSKPQMEKVLGYIASGKEEGAQLVAGGERAQVGGLDGNFVLPTVFDRVQSGMRIAREEIFGPVLATLEFNDPEEAIAQANATPYGLAAGVWTRDAGKAQRAARALKAGTIWINTYNRYDAALPFGGYKLSGYGRELGAAALEHYTQLKSVWMDLEG
jgi:acyl-CoA reductase-like NAD-dependent aldehyde dehydrogenase